MGRIPALLGQACPVTKKLKVCCWSKYVHGGLIEVSAKNSNISMYITCAGQGYAIHIIAYLLSG